MAEIIAVCGYGNSGKSTLGIKLAADLYRFTKGERVIFLSPDTSVPTLGLLLPHRSSSELFSLGAALDRTEITGEDVMRELVVFRKKKNLGILAYKLGEDRFSYPEPTPDKVDMFVKALGGVCDYIVADTTGLSDDIISSAFRRECDVALEIYNPTVKSLIYESSKRPADAILSGKTVKVLNITTDDKYIPEKDFTEKTKSSFRVRYSPYICYQAQCGMLCEELADPGFRKDIRELTKEVLRWKK